MSMSLLLDDDDLKPHLSISRQDMIETASVCADVTSRICQEAIEIFRGDVNKRNRRTAENEKDSNGMTLIVIGELVKNVSMVMDLLPKKVAALVSVTDDLKVFRSINKYLTNALKKTAEGNVRKYAVLLVFHH
jgi:GH24 family phage-related lysozyme (muramidase)